MNRCLFWLTIGLTLTGCAQELTDGFSKSDLSEQYDCLYGFHLGNQDQTAGLFVSYTDWAAAQHGDVIGSSPLPGEHWRAELQFGAELFANWCDDVLEPGEPIPDVHQVWELSGAIQLTELPGGGCPNVAGATLTDVTAHGPGGEVIDLGDIEVRNDFWGCVPG